MAKEISETVLLNMLRDKTTSVASVEYKQGNSKFRVFTYFGTRYGKYNGIECKDGDYYEVELPNDQKDILNCIDEFVKNLEWCFCSICREQLVKYKFMSEEDKTKSGDNHFSKYGEAVLSR